MLPLTLFYSWQTGRRRKAIEIRADGRVLPYRQYGPLAEIDQGGVVEHKRLSHVLQVAQALQAQRDNSRIGKALGLRLRSLVSVSMIGVQIRYKYHDLRTVQFRMKNTKKQCDIPNQYHDAPQGRRMVSVARHGITQNRYPRSYHKENVLEGAGRHQPIAR